MRSIYILHNKYTGRRSIFRSKPTSIHGPDHKSDLNYIYSRSHFSWLTEAVAKELTNSLYHKVSYDSIIIDQVVNRFSPNEVKVRLHICDH